MTVNHDGSEVSLLKYCYQQFELDEQNNAEAPMTELSFFEFEVTGDVFVVTVRQHTCNATSAALLSEEKLLASEFTTSAAIHAVVDFRHLEYFNSIVLKALFRLWTSVESKLGRMAICELSSVGNEIIAISGLQQLWPICQTREQALQKIGTSP